MPYYYLPLHNVVGTEILIGTTSQPRTTALRLAPMVEIVKGIMMVWRQVLGDVVFPTDDGQALAQMVHNSETVWCWSDGLAKDGIDLHTFTL